MTPSPKTREEAQEEFIKLFSPAVPDMDEWNYMLDFIDSYGSSIEAETREKVLGERDQKPHRAWCPASQTCNCD